MQTTVQYVHEPMAHIDIGPHVFPTEKYDLLADAIRRELGVDEARFHGWEALTSNDLARVHTPQRQSIHSRSNMASCASK